VLFIIEHPCISLLLVVVVARFSPIAVALSALIPIVLSVLRVESARLVPLILAELFLLFLKFVIKWLSTAVRPLIDVLGTLIKLLVSLDWFSLQRIKLAKVLSSVIFAIVIHMLPLLRKHCKVQLVFTCTEFVI
jgi:hypothetical protein